VWIKRYATESEKIKIVEVSDEIKRRLTKEQTEALKMLGNLLKEAKEVDIREEINRIANSFQIEPAKVFEAAYTVLLGKPFGPRLIPFIQSLDKNFVVKRFTELE
jgi:lysyl-tRNA synthetase class 1